MFTQFLGKISGVFNLAFQGISKVLGVIVDTVVTVVDAVFDTVTAITQPITEQLSELPIVGDTVDSILELQSNLVGNLSGGLHAVADQLLEGDLIGSVETALNGVTSTVGETLADVSNVITEAVELTTPITGLVSDVPVLAPLLDSVGETTTNLIGLVSDTGDFVAQIQPLDLVSGLLDNPTGTVGGVLLDVSGTVDDLLNDLSPITNAVAEIPVVGTLVDTAGEVTGALTQGLYDAGQMISNIDLLDPFNQLAVI